MNKPSKITSPERLRIGLVFDDSLDRLDGVSQQVRIIGAWLAAQGHQVRYLVGETTMPVWAGGKVYSLSRNLAVSFNRNRLSVPLAASRQQIRQVVADEQFDVLHVQMPYSPFMAQRVIKLSGPQTAVVGSFHILPAGWVASWGARLLGLWQRRSLKRFDEVVAVSPAAADFAGRAFKIDSQVLPNMIDVAKFATVARARPASAKQIVFLGRLVPRKGCLELLKAFELVHQQLPDAKLVIAGDGPERRRLEHFSASRSLSQSVSFAGFIEEDQKATLLADADIACFPSLYGESFGVILLEAMAAGASVVLGGDNPGYRSVLGQQPELLVNPRDTRQFADRLHRLLSDQALTDKLHTWQLQQVKSYDVGVVMPRLVEVYRRAIAKRTKPRA